ncbi:MAG TPA: hypothetical protein VL404_00765 [Candidatus Eisenbacteria bacterium]|jgi:hypothetical protein|nr:hypothetical protein [Candidatus Eisenbacteria bacterium]
MPSTRFIEKNLSTALVVALFLAYLGRLYFPPTHALFYNSDFEVGTLANWNSQGWANERKAFDNQPTYGDNPWYRNAGSCHPAGDYWVGSFENRHDPEEPKGRSQGEDPIGRLVSVPFEIRKGKIEFRLGGGDNTDREGVGLEVGGQMVRFERGRGLLIEGEQMRRVVWDVTPWIGKQAQVVIVDESRGPWGHINADDFRYS